VTVQQTIYDAVRRVHGQREVFLEDIIRIGCGYRHFLHLSDAERKRPVRPQDLLLKQVSLKTKLMISRYFKECYGERFTPGYCRVTPGGIITLLDGVLDRTLVDIQVLSKSEFTTTRAPRRAVLAAATKAVWDDKEDALLVVINRDTQEWCFWYIYGDLEKHTEPIRHDVDYIDGLVSGDSTPQGMAAESTCRICPYLMGCPMEPSSDPPMYSADGLTVRVDTTARTALEDYLWSLNDKPNDRATKVIHPSSFSTSKCDREIAYSLLGTEQNERVNPKLRRIFDVGHCVHAVLQEAMLDAVPGFKAEVPVVHEELRISGHCDGQWGKSCAEIKSIGSKGFSSLQKAKSDHEKQGTTYGVILEADDVYYIYYNKETGELAVFPVNINRGTWHKLAARASNIVKTVETDDMPPRLEKDWSCRSCRYAWACKPHLGTTTNSEQKRTFS